MCYLEFIDIILVIDNMDVDVIFFEVSCLNFEILDEFKVKNF